MPFVFVYNIPSKGMERARALYLDEKLKASISSVSELELEHTDIDTIFVENGMYRQTERIIVSVEDLYERPRRTQEVLDRVALQCVETVRSIFKTVPISCRVKTFEGNMRSEHTLPREIPEGNPSKRWGPCTICGEQALDRKGTGDICPNCDAKRVYTLN